MTDPATIERLARENWAPVPGFEASHEVSNLGRLRNLKTGRFVVGTVYSSGYRQVCLSVAGKVSRMTMHRVVALAWIGPRPDGLHIDHIDGNRVNNGAENLRYVTPKENVGATVSRSAHAYGSKNGQTKLTDQQVCKIRIAAGGGKRCWGAAQLAKAFGVSECQVRRAASGATFKCIDAPPARCAAAIRAL